MAGMSINEAMNWIQSNPNSLGSTYGQLFAVQNGLREYPGDPELQRQADFLVGQVEEAKAEQEQEAFDSGEFGAAACDCAPGEPCCLRAMKVYDSKSASRKIEWPIPENGPNRLYIITKEATGGRASGKVTAELTDWERCKQGLSNKPTIGENGFHDGAPETISSNKVEKTVTSPVQLPAFNIPMFPNELLQVIWILQILVRSATYTDGELPTLSPMQCNDPSGAAIKIVPIPHLKAEASVTGEVSVTFRLSSLPTFEAKLSGSAKGEFGNQVVEYTASATGTNSPVSAPRQGPVNTPIFAFIDKINNAMKGLADEGRTKPYEAQVLEPVTFATQSSLRLAFSVTVNAPTLQLAGKSNSPNLELTLDAFGLRFGPKVTGTVDLLDLMLSRIPYGPEIRERLAHPGGVVSASAECSITLEGEGIVGFEVMNAVTIEIGSAEGWETEFGKIDVRFSGELKITGTIKANARLDVRTWFFDAHASAGAEVSTGWQFGARVTANDDGTQKWEELYHFQGITLKAYANVAAGTDTGNDPTKRPALPSPDGRTESRTQTDRDVTSRTNLAEPAWERVLMDPSGSKTRWHEMQ